MEPSAFGAIIVLVILLLLYFIPSFIAQERQHRNLLAIIALNFFLGWTFLGWIGAFIWGLTDNTRKAQSAVIQTSPVPSQEYPPPWRVTAQSRGQTIKDWMLLGMVVLMFLVLWGHRDELLARLIGS